MPNFFDAVTKISVNRKNVKDIPGNPFAMKRLISSNLEREPISLKTRLKVDTYVSRPSSLENQTYTDMAKQMSGMLENSRYSEWAPWSPISRMIRK